jgi:hypothetical protein
VTSLPKQDMRHYEKKQLQEMIIAKHHMMRQLEDFKIHMESIKDLKEQKDQEIIMISRLVKAEVIDIAVMMDKLTTVIDRQEEKIDQLQSMLEIVVRREPLESLRGSIALKNSSIIADT